MNNSKLISAILLIVLAFSIFSFVLVSATEPEGDDNQDNTTAASSAVIETTQATTATTKSNNSGKNNNSTKGGQADPKTNTTQATTQATVAATTSAKAAVVTDANTTEAEVFTTEEVEETTTEEITEPTTQKKNISDYGVKYRPLKWISLVIAFGCVVALFVVNIRYRRKYGKKNANLRKRPNIDNNSFRNPEKPVSEPTKPVSRQQKPVLDTSARFDNTPSKDENLDKTAIVDMSSFKNKQKPNNDDDDLYI